jgi:adenylate cyclase
MSAPLNRAHTAEIPPDLSRSAGSVVPPALSPTPEAIREQLERILSSTEFAVPERARRFLKYLIDETLAGRADRIKAYSIAIEVFGRNESFDAQNDPAVRIEAGRIRRALERYYLVAGQADPIVIGIPKGGYVPHFELRGTDANAFPADLPAPAADPAIRVKRRLDWRWAAALAAVLLVCAAAAGAYRLWYSGGTQALLADYVPKVVVTPFADLGSDAASKSYAAGLTAEIVDQLVKFKDIVVIAETPSPSAAASKGDGAPQFELTGSVRTSADRLRFLINLVDRTNGHMIWTKAYEDSVRVDTLFDFQKDVAATVATEIGQAYGIIIRANSARLGQRPPDNAEAYSCMMSYFAYRQGLVEAQHADVRTCLERAVAGFPDFATGWALLAMVLLDEDRFGYNQQPQGPAPLARALEAARNAVSLDPDNVRAQQALMNVYFFTNNVEMGVKTGRQALALNPNDMELLGEFGVRLATSGQWAEGDAMIERALAHNPSNANYYLTTQAAAAYILNDYVRATELIERAKSTNPLLQLIACAIYGQRGMAEEARAAAGRYYATGSDMLANIDAELKKRNVPDADKTHFVDGLRKAGLPVKSAFLKVTASG